MSRVRVRSPRDGVSRPGIHAWLLLLAVASALPSRDQAPVHASPSPRASFPLAQAGDRAPAVPGGGETAPAPMTSGPGEMVPLAQPVPAPVTPGSGTPVPAGPRPISRPQPAQGQPAGEPPVQIWQPETRLAPARPRRNDPAAAPSPSRSVPAAGTSTQPVAPGPFPQRVDPLTGGPLVPQVRSAPGGPTDPRLMPMAPVGSPPPTREGMGRPPFVPGQTMVPLPPPQTPQVPSSRPAPAPASTGSGGPAGPWTILVPLVALAGAVGVFLADRKRRAAGQAGGETRPRINLADRLRPGSGGSRREDR